MERKVLLVTFAALFCAGAFVYARQNDASLTYANAASKFKSITISNANLPNSALTAAKIYDLFFAGAGIAVNPDDKLDFKYIRIIGGRVLVPHSNVSENSSNSSDLDVKCVNIAGKERCFTFVRAGLLYLDKDRYTLRKIDFDNDSATASIYSNDTEVGSIALVKIVKIGRIMWVGTLTVKNVDYYAYILGANNPLLAGGGKEALDKVEDRKECGPKMPSINVTEISNCKQNGGRIYIGRDENGCPTAPTCVTANCTKVTPMSTQNKTDCRKNGGTIVAGVDDDGCPAVPKCILASGEVR